jgi:hypothetical protein
LHKRAALFLLLALLAAPSDLRAEEEKPARDPRLRKALEKSLLFPGLGQLYEKQYAKAAIFGLAEAACLALVVVHIGKGNDAYWNYRQAATTADATAWRRETERLDRRRNTAILAAAGIWVLNLADILVFTGKKYGRERSLAFQPFYRHENQAYGAGVTCRF